MFRAISKVVVSSRESSILGAIAIKASDLYSSSQIFLTIVKACSVSSMLEAIAAKASDAYL